MAQIEAKIVAAFPEFSPEHAKCHAASSASLPPVAFNFLGIYLQEAGVGKLTSCRAQYYCERALQEHAMLYFKPSKVAATAVLLALRANGDAWVRLVAAKCGL